MNTAMKNNVKQTFRELTVMGVSAAGAFLAVKGVDELYGKIAKEEPPKTVENTNYPFIKVIGYTLATSLFAGCVRLFLRDKVTEKLNA